MKTFIFIVTWCIVNVVSDPPPAPKTDEFGRTNSFMADAVYRFHYEYDCGHEKTFTNRDSAIAFFNRAANQTGFRNELSDVKLDSMEVK